MNFKEAAYQILKQEETPLSAKEITSKAIEEGLIEVNPKNWTLKTE